MWLCYKLLNIYTTQYGKLSEYSKKRVNVLDRPESLTLDFDEDDLPLEGDEEVKFEPEEIIVERIKLNRRKITETWLKILTPNKLLTSLPILLAQIKAGNNSYKLKNEIRQILYFLHQHNLITKKGNEEVKFEPEFLQQFNLVIIIIKENMIVIRDPKTFCLILIGLKMLMRI